MNELTKEQVAWLAGIYEGEGSCAVTNGRAIRVDITMTDEDVIRKIHQITGIGSVRTLPPREDNHKTAFGWGVGSASAVLFLEAIMPWLCERRTSRAREAILNWRLNKRQSTSSDTECVKGHPYDSIGNRRTKYGTCHLCNLESSRRHREKVRTISQRG